MINKYQNKKEGLKTSRVSPSDEPNPVGYHSNTLPSSDEFRLKSYKPDHNNNISLVTRENIRLVTTGEDFVCNAQVIVTSRYQGGKLVLDW